MNLHVKKKVHLKVHVNLKIHMKLHVNLQMNLNFQVQVQLNLQLNLFFPDKTVQVKVHRKVQKGWEP